MSSAVTFSRYDELPELVLQPCEACGGEGYRLEISEAAQTYDEHPEGCAVCGGSGEVEVCSCCGEVPQLSGGAEVCSCVTVPLRRAA